MLVNTYGNLESVLPNVDITLDDNCKNNPYLSWGTTEDNNGILHGLLKTGAMPEDRTCQSLTFILSGYTETMNGMETISVSHTINVWIFPAITEVQISTQLNEVYLQDTLGYYDVRNGLGSYKFNYTTRPQVGPTDTIVNYFGNFNASLDIVNKDSIELVSIANTNSNILSIKYGGEEITDKKIVIYLGDIIECEELEDEGDENTVYYFANAKISEKEYEVTYNRTIVDDIETLTENLKLLDLLKLMLDTEDESIIFNRIFKENQYIDAKVTGYVSQFGRQVPVSTTIRIKKAKKIASITTTLPYNDSERSLYFELDDNMIDADPEFSTKAQSFTFNITPYDATNKQLDFKVFDLSNTEQNLNIVSLKTCTLASDGTITLTNGTKLYFNSADNKFYKAFVEGVYTEEYEYGYNRINNITFVVEEIRNSIGEEIPEGIKTIATVRIVDNTIEISNVIEEAGAYRIEIISFDSYYSTMVDVEEVIRYRAKVNFMLYIGDGSIDNPYQIRNANGLIRMWQRNIILNENEEDKEVHYILNNNINITNNNFNDYILNSKNIFKGTFNGNGYTINGLTVNHNLNTKLSREFNIGLLPVVAEGSEVYDLTLANIKINSIVGISDFKYDYNIGGLAGKSTGAELTNVFVNGNINIFNNDITESIQAVINVGGMIGLVDNGSIVQEETSGVSLNSNVAIDFRGVSADTVQQGTHNLGGLLGSAKGDITIEGLSLIPNIISRQDEYSVNVSKANIGGLVGSFAEAENVLIKDITIAPMIRGYQNLGGVVGIVGDATTEIEFDHVVVEFAHTESLANSIIGYDRLAGFVGHNLGSISFNNSYVFDICKKQAETTFVEGSYNGSIVVLNSTSIVDASAGGFAGINEGQLSLSASHFTGVINNFATSNYVAGIAGKNTSNISITDAYVDGKIYGTEFPLAVVGGLATPTATTQSIGMVSTTYTEYNNFEKNEDGEWVVGSNYSIVSESVESGKYREYEFVFTGVEIDNFYSKLNTNFIAFVDEDTRMTVKEANASVLVKTTTTFAIISDDYMAVTGVKIVEDYTLGTQESYTFINTELTYDEYSDSNIFVDLEYKEIFEELGFYGAVGDIASEDVFVMNSYILSTSDIDDTSTDLGIDLYHRLITALGVGDPSVNYPNIISAISFINEKSTYLQSTGTVDVDDFVMTNANIGAMYGKTLYADTENLSTWLRLYNDEYSGTPVVVTDEVSGDDVDAHKFTVRVYEEGEANFVIAIDEAKNIYRLNDSDEFVLLYDAIVIDGEYYYTDSNGSFEYNGTTLYVKEETIYTDSVFETEWTEDVDGFAQYDVFIINEESWYVFNKASLYYDASMTVFALDAECQKVDEKYLITIRNTQYLIEEGDEVLLPLSIYEIAKDYGFGVTTTETTATLESAKNGYMYDDKNNIIAKVDENGKFVYDEYNAIWAVNDDVNGGLPVLFEKLDVDESSDKLNLLYNSIGHMTGSVVEFDNGNESDSSKITAENQAYIMIDDSNMILFYNRVDNNQSYVGLNTYTVAMSEEDKETLDAIGIGYNAPLIIDFTNVVLNNPYIELNGKNEYIISSNNSSILEIGNYRVDTSVFNTLCVKGTGEVVLTFKNVYDDENVFEIKAYIVGGITGVGLYKNNNEVTEMSTYVNKLANYNFTFVNKIHDADNESYYDFDNALGGYEVELKEGDSGVIRINSKTIVDGETYVFDMADSLSIYGVKGLEDSNEANIVKLEFRPYIVYGDNQKYYLTYMNQEFDVSVFNLAKSISAGISNKITIKPEENTKFELKLVSSNESENVYMTVKDNTGKNIFIGNIDSVATEILKLDTLLGIETTKASSEIGNNLYEIVYTVYLSMDIQNYFDMYQRDNYQNPLRNPARFQFEFIPESWMDDAEGELPTETGTNYDISSTLRDEYQSAEFEFVIEGNNVEQIDSTLYALNTQSDSSGQYSIDTSICSTTKLAPGSVGTESYGLLRLKLQKEYNNAKYIEITSLNPNVSIQQCLANADSNNVLQFSKLSQSPTIISNVYGDGIRLWNIMYNSTNLSQEVDFVSQYYVLIGFNNKVVQGSTINFVVRVYDDAGNVLQETIPVGVEYLPKVEILTADGKSNALRAIGEYLPVRINHVALEGNVTWSVGIKTGASIYEVDGAVVTNISSAKLPYLVYRNNDGDLQRAEARLSIEELDREYYIFVPEECFLGDYTFTISGYRVINTITINSPSTFDLKVVMAEIEDVYIVGTVGNIFTIKFSNYTTFTAEIIFNDYAMELIAKTERSDIENVVYNKLISFQGQISGQNEYDTDRYFNAWCIDDGSNITRMQNGVSYNDSSFKFFKKFFKKDLSEVNYFGITASKISVNQLYCDFDYGYRNGVLVLNHSGEVSDLEEEGWIKKPFTLQITDNSDVDHPNPIQNVQDFIDMLDFMTEEKVNEIVNREENENVDPSELEFGNYILLNDLVLENWKPRELHVSNFDANGFTITIKSWDFSDYSLDEDVVAGLFSRIGQYTVVQNLNIDVSNLLTASKSTSEENIPTAFKTSGGYFKNVTFGIVAGENEGVITNTKVVNLDSTKSDYVLNIFSKQGYADGQECSARISAFVANNSGSISNSFVGLNAVDSSKTEDSATGLTYSTITRAQTESLVASKKIDRVYPFSLYAGNKVAGFVVENGGVISNSYVMGVSITNRTNINNNSLTAGFVDNNKHNGSIYSCFVSGYEFTGYGTDIVNLRSTKTTIESKGDIGGFVHTNNGSIENAYSIVNIIINSRYSAGFVYNNANGVVENAYTTSVTQNIYTQAHGMFIKEKENIGTLTNCYYLLKEGEMGITSNNASPDILSSIDPTNAIISYPDLGGNVPAEEGISFAKVESFEGFSFVDSSEDLNGIWYLDATSQTAYPRLINTINYNTIKIRSLILDDIDDDMTDESVLYNYEYNGTPNVGTSENPIVISTPIDLVRTIITNTNEYEYGRGKKLHIFGGILKNNGDTTTFNPRYIRLVNNISFSLLSLKNTYKVNNAETYIPLSQVVFNGILVGNGMKISDITLNNTNNSGTNLEDFGLFKQIGLSDKQLNDLTPTDSNDTGSNGLVYNLKLSYSELTDPSANKVGVLAGSIYNATILSVDIEGNEDEASQDVSIVTGRNLVGALAGLIAGNEDLTISDISVKNVRVRASKNSLVGLNDTMISQDGYYKEFVSIDGKETKANYNTIDYQLDDANGVVINNINDISYAGGVAGAIIVDNFSNSDGVDIDIDDMTAYNLTQYRNSTSKIHTISVSDNIEIVGDQAGGLFGLIGGNAHIRNSKFVLMEGANNNENYQRVYGYTFGGLIAGQTDDAVLERINIEHSEPRQTEIDSKIAEIPTDGINEVSKSDLFLNSAGAGASVAIGGIVGNSNNTIILDSYNKANVVNQNSKIAGGMIGFATGKNAIGYSYTYANVEARDIAGGLVGFYKYNSFDLYLYNAIGLNVWDEDTEKALKTNLSIIYETSKNFKVRMPELGNQISEVYDANPGINKYVTSNKTVENMAAGSRYVYIGSVLGKATLAPGTYTYDRKSLEIASDGSIKYVSNSTGQFIKNIFVHNTSVNNNCYNVKEDGTNTKLYSIALFTSTKNYAVTDANIQAHNAQRVLFNSVNKTAGTEDKNYYYTYYNDNTYNVYSSVYGKTSRVGDVAEGNMNSSFTGFTVNNEQVNNTTDKIRYNTIFGTQYPLSKMTGYYVVSENQVGIDYEEYINVFNTVLGYGFDLGENTLKKAMKSYTVDDANEYIYSVGETDVTENRDSFDDATSYLGSLIGGSEISTSRTWYFNEETQLVEYNIGQKGAVSKITNYAELAAAFNTNNKGKIYTIEPESGNLINVNPDDNSSIYIFKDKFKGILQGDEDNRPTLKISINADNSKMFVSGFEGATIKNINFVFDFGDIEGAYKLTSDSEYFGFVAPYIERTTFENCDFTFIGDEGKVITWQNYSIDYNIFSNNWTYKQSKTAGLLFGKSSLSTIIDVDVEFKENITLSSSLNNFGSIVGHAQSGSISNVDISKTGGGNILLNVTQGYVSKNTETKLYYFNNEKSIDNIAIGGVVGLNEGANISYITSNIVINSILGTFGGGSKTTYSAVGGIIGTMKKGTSNPDISYTNYNGNANIDIYSNSNFAFGGIVGNVDDGTISNCFVNNSIEDSATKNTNNYTFNIEIDNKNKDFVNTIGGLVGRIRGGFNYDNIFMDTPINLNLMDDKINSIYVGAVAGLHDYGTSNWNLTRFINIADIKVVGQNNDKINIGGLFGSTTSGITEAYNQGDIMVKGGQEINVGGLVGSTKEIPSQLEYELSYSNVASYGDIKFVYCEGSKYKYNLAGLVGKIETNSNKLLYIGSSYSLAEIYAVDDDFVTPTNYSKYMKQDVISGVISDMLNVSIDPFVANHGYYLSSGDSDSMYIKESYFDTYYAHLYNYSNAKNGKNPLSGNKSYVGNTQYAKDYRDIYETIKNTFVSSDGFADETIDYRIDGLWYFETEYEEGSRFNPNELTTLSSSIAGYNILAIGSEEINISNNVTVAINSVLVGEYDSTKPDEYVKLRADSSREITNFGVMANMAIVSPDKLTIENNYGVLENMVGYGEDKSSYSDSGLTGLVMFNYGYVYRSGSSVTYTNIQEDSSVCVAGVVFDNYGTIDTVYSTSMMTNVDLEGIGKYADVTSAGIAYKNWNGGVILNTIFTGSLLHGKAELFNIVYSASSSSLASKLAENNLSDKFSMKYESVYNMQLDELDELCTIVGDENAYQKAYLKYYEKFVYNQINDVNDITVNYGRPYVKGGIAIPTKVSYSESLDTYYYYGLIPTGSKEIRPVMNISDYLMLTKSAIGSDVHLFNDLDFSIVSNDDFSSINMSKDTSFYGNGYSLIGGYSGSSTDTGYTKSLFMDSLQINIYDLVISKFYINGRGILAGSLGMNVGMDTGRNEIKNVTIKDSKFVAADNIDNGLGVLTSTLRGYEISMDDGKEMFDKVTITFGGSRCFGYVAGYMYNSTIKNLTLKATIDLSKCSYMGGIAGYAENSKFEKINTELAIKGKDYIGGIVGYGKYVELIDCNNKLSGTNNIIGQGNLGGIVGYLQGGSIVNCKNETDIISDATIGSIANSKCIGGIAGTFESGGASSKVEGIVNKGDIVGRENVGGLIGYAENIDINKYTYVESLITKTVYNDNYGQINSDTIVGGSKYIGGIVGKYKLIKSTTTMDGCRVNYGNTTELTISGYNYIGGLVGMVESEFTTTKLTITNSSTTAINLYLVKLDEIKDTNKGSAYNGSEFKQLEVAQKLRRSQWDYHNLYRVSFRDEDITWGSPWFSPVNQNSGYLAQYDSWSKLAGQVGGSYIQPDKSGKDDSVYFSTLYCGYSKPSLNGDDWKDALFSRYDETGYSEKYDEGMYIDDVDTEHKLYGGLVVGYLPEHITLDNSATHSESCRINNGKNDSNIVLDTFTHWFYCSVEIDASTNYRNSIMMSIEYQYGLDETQKIGRDYIFDVDFDNLDNGSDTEKTVSRKIFDVYIRQGFTMGKTKTWKLHSDNNQSFYTYRVKDDYEGLRLYTGDGLPNYSGYKLGIIQRMYHTINNENSWTDFNNFYQIEQIATKI